MTRDLWLYLFAASLTLLWLILFVGAGELKVIPRLLIQLALNRTDREIIRDVLLTEFEDFADDDEEVGLRELNEHGQRLAGLFR